MYMKNLLYLVRTMIFTFILLFILLLALLVVSASELEHYPSNMITRYVIYDSVPQETKTISKIPSAQPSQGNLGYKINKMNVPQTKYGTSSDFVCSTTRVFNTFRRMDDERFDVDDLSGESYTRTCYKIGKKPHLEIPLPLSLRPDSREAKLRNLGYRYIN